ncbi:cytochrome P450 93A3-like [Arachis duranensis]|uniref:Cytochrome P450 93A3-like n=1 Tax=Arachis duranensis TaxID=130453 RepID=A0A6P4DJT0_ARADU|nr:cytochrome P450 93A3-like [Arachis duranensis]
MEILKQNMADLQSYIQVLLICAVSTIFIGSIILRKRKQNHSSLPLPPGPKALPIIGHLHLLSSTPHQDFYKFSTRYGPIIHLYLGSAPCVVVSTAEAAKEFLKTHETSFSDRPAQTVAIEALTYGFKDFLFAPYGPYWKFMKKVCMSELLGGKMLHQLLHVRQQETRRFLSVLVKKGVAGEAVDVGGQLMTISNNIVSRMIMRQTSCGDGEIDEEVVRKLVADTAELTGKFNLSDFLWFLKDLDVQGFKKKLKEIRVRFDGLLDRAIEEHKDESKKNKGEGARDILDVLLHISEDETADIKLDTENIKAFIMDILVAGTDTTAVTMEWAMAELMKNPEVMEKARQEVDSVVGKKRIVEESDIPNLVYIQAIVKETLRLHPAGPLLFRQCSRRAIVNGYEIPAKCRLFVNVWAIGRDPNHWENPLEFRPERFMGKQMDVRGQQYELIPFGSGRRMCPGISLALQIAHVTLAAMIQCFEWKLHDDEKILDMEEKPAGIVNPRAHPLIALPLPRLNPFPSISQDI